MTFRYVNVYGSTTFDVDLGTAAVRLGSISSGLCDAAELGQPATGGIEVDDPDGSLDLLAFQYVRVVEDEAPAGSQWITTAWIGDRDVDRGDSSRPSLILDAARVWSVDLYDINSVLTFRRIRPGNARPAESAADRLAWLITTAPETVLNDFGNVAYPAYAMDACDYTAQTFNDVLGDIFQEGAYNWWVAYNEAEGAIELFSMDPNGTDYTTSTKISNVLADVDGVSVLYPAGGSARMHRSGQNLASEVFVPYDGGTAYAYSSATADVYNIMSQVAPSANVKSGAKASAVGAKLLTEADGESDRITVTVMVPPANVNDIRHGHRLQAKFSHLPGYGNYTWMRVMQRAVIQQDQTTAFYRVRLELVPQAAAGPCSGSTAPAGFYAPLNDTGQSDATGLVAYTNAGNSTDIPVPFFPGGLYFPSYGTGGSPDYTENAYTSSEDIRFFALGPGSAVVETATTAHGSDAPDAGNTYVITVLHFTGSGAAVDSTSAPAQWGTPTTVTVPEDGYCNHVVILGRAGAVNNCYVGFAGVTWTPA